jgi:hypothetical protein
MVVTCLVAAGAGQVAAQGERAMPLILQLPMSTRALGMGNAYVLALGDADAVFYHPGLLDTSRGMGLSMSRYGSESSLFAASAAAEWFRGGVGVGLQTLSYSAASLGSGAFVQGEEGLSATGPVAATENVASVAYARVLFGFRVGLAAKLIEQRLPAERDVTVAADLGVARNIGLFTFGLAARNFGRDPDLEAFDAELPWNVTLGGSTRSLPFGPLDVVAAAAGTWARDEHWEAGGGIEAAYWPVSGRTFIGRVGVRWVEDSEARPLTLGAGFSGDRIVLDYAFQDFDAGKPLHRLTVRWR